LALILVVHPFAFVGLAVAEDEGRLTFAKTALVARTSYEADAMPGVRHVTTVFGRIG
jgi:hypothetical protein